MPGAAGSQVCGLQLRPTLSTCRCRGERPASDTCFHVSLPQLNSPNPPDVNCADQLGNTPLHCAAYRARGPCVLALLRSGADPNLRNRHGEQALGGEAVHGLVFCGRLTVRWPCRRQGLCTGHAAPWPEVSIPFGVRAGICERNPTALCPKEPHLRREQERQAFSCDVSSE